MAKIEILGSEFAEKLELQFAPSIKAGFPSPADDYLQDRLDFNRDLIRHPETTFYGRVSGDSMMDAGINDGDIAVIDKSIEASDGDIVVGYVNNEFTVISSWAMSTMSLQSSSWTCLIERKDTLNCVLPTRTSNRSVSMSRMISRSGAWWYGRSRTGTSYK